MKSKKQKGTDEYRYLKTKLFLRAVGIFLLATAIIAGLYNFFLRGHFADVMVGFMDYFIYKDYYMAYHAYERIFRNNQETILLISIIIVFLIQLSIYVRSFARYFKEINRGIDSLITKEAGDVSLSPELSAVEKKINSVKHTLIRQSSELKAAEQRKNDLIMYLAHDLKTPLASVIGYLNLLHDEGQISEELRERYLSITMEKAERLEDLINEFFEITRFNLSNITLQYSNINLTRLLEQLAYEFKPMLEEKGLSCRLSADDGLMLRCDADKLQRVFDNLLRNAVLYSYENTEISITAIAQSERLIITFANLGATIPQEKIDRIFEQFYRLDSARSTKSGGAGLGLAIAKQIVELHGGTITAYSEQDRTEFTVSLPCSVMKS